MPEHETYTPFWKCFDKVTNKPKCIHAKSDKLHGKVICRYDGSIRNLCKRQCAHYRMSLLNRFFRLVGKQVRQDETNQ